MDQRYEQRKLSTILGIHIEADSSQRLLGTKYLSHLRFY